MGETGVVSLRALLLFKSGKPYQGDTLLPYPSLSRGEKKTPTKTPGTRVLLPVCRGKHCG